MRHSIGRAVLAGSALAVLAAVVACGGGGGGSGAPGTLPAGSSPANVQFTVTVPSGSSSTSSTQRKPAFVSPNAQSIAVAVSAAGTSPGAPTVANLSSTSPNCTTGTTGLTCTVSLNSPVGNDTFAVTLYAGANASGTVLAMSTVTATIAASGTTNVPVVLGGVVASIGVSIPNGTGFLPGGYATSVPVMVQAKDPSGATIVGGGNYTNPITLTNADTSGVTALSTTTVTSPATVVTLAYNPTDTNGGVLAVAGLPIGQTTIGASASSVAASAVTPGVFQYNADRFFGLGHTRTLNGTANVVSITYNGAGMVTGTQSWTYTIADLLTIHGGLTMNGLPVLEANHAYTYTQTAGVPAAPPETETFDQYRSASVGATSTILYRQGNVDTDDNGNTIQSPITGYFPGTTTRTDTYPAVNGWQEDVLPHVSGAAWNNSFVPVQEAWTGAQVSTFNLLADNSWTFNETTPNTLAQTQSATGMAQNTNNGFTTTVSLPVGGTIPVAQETTSPLTPPVTNWGAANWYPGGGAPVQPLYSQAFSEGLTSIPSTCNVPASIATQAYVLIQVTNQLDVAIFRNRQQVQADYFVPGGIGYVCDVFLESDSNYRYQTGIISNQTSVTYTIGVQSTGALSARRAQ